MDYLLSYLVNVFLLIFGLFMALAGIFTIYFGAGKSRKLGVLILIVGLGVMGLMYWLFTAGYTDPSNGLISLWDYLKGPILTLLGGLIGAGVALLVFIGIITKA